VVGLVLKWIEAQGGLEAIERHNEEKASLIYDALDAYPHVYEPTVREKQDRSQMNITFRLRETNRDREFLEGAQARDMEGLKGHRSVGGFRASIYNAFPREGACALAEYLHDFATK
jgi:phosphoserine aminotransferase